MWDNREDYLLNTRTKQTLYHFTKWQQLKNKIAYAVLGWYTKKEGVKKKLA